MEIPPRVHHAVEAQIRFPDLFERLLPALADSDPLADRAISDLRAFPASTAHRLIASALDGDRSVPASLAELVDVSQKVPDWVDMSRIDRAGRVFFRAGIFGGLSLGMRSLVYGYAAPVGNKPLAFSGALEKKAQRRLAETGRFVTSVTEEGQMRPGGQGFRNTIHVRLMHAQVRGLALEDPRWNRAAWGLPINQHDMLATILLFSSVFLEGIRRFGVDVTTEEEEDYIALWCWVGVVMGVRADLLPRSATEAHRMGEFVRLTQGPPDADSRALVSALLKEPLRQARSPEELRRARKMVAAAEGICRALLDEDTARALGLRPTFSTGVIAPVHRTFDVLGKIRRRIPALDDWVQRAGARYWAWNVERGLRGGGAMFPLPTKLEGASRHSDAWPHTRG